MEVTIYRDGSLVVTIVVKGNETDTPAEVAKAYKEVAKELEKKREEG